MLDSHALYVRMKERKNEDVAYDFQLQNTFYDTERYVTMVCMPGERSGIKGRTGKIIITRWNKAQIETQRERKPTKEERKEADRSRTVTRGGGKKKIHSFMSLVFLFLWRKTTSITRGGKKNNPFNSIHASFFFFKWIERTSIRIAKNTKKARNKKGGGGR